MPRSGVRRFENSALMSVCFVGRLSRVPSPGRRMLFTVGIDSSSATNGSSMASVAGKKRWPIKPCADAGPARTGTSASTHSRVMNRRAVMNVPPRARGPGLAGRGAPLSELRERPDEGGSGGWSPSQMGTVDLYGRDRVERGQRGRGYGEGSGVEWRGVALGPGEMLGAGEHRAGGGRLGIAQVMDGVHRGLEPEDRDRQREGEGERGPAEPATPTQSGA